MRKDKLKDFKLKQHIQNKIYPERELVLVLKHLDTNVKIEFGFKIKDQSLFSKWGDELNKFTHKKRPLPQK